MDNYWGTLMKNKAKVLVTVVIVGFPLMFAFQNCARNSAQMQDAASQKTASSSLDTNNITDDQPVSINQNAPAVDPAPAPSSGPSNDQTSNVVPPEQPSALLAPKKDVDSSVSNQVEDPEQELMDNTAEAPDLCEAHRHESQNSKGNGTLSADGKSISHIRGDKVLSPEDFGGRTEIDTISDAFGKIVLCDLKVKKVEKSGGRLILEHSTVKSISGFRGDCGVSQDSQATIDNSNVTVYHEHGRK